MCFEVPSLDPLQAVRRRLVERGASDGRINEFGALVTLGFTDPDGMRTEVGWVRDPSVADLHPPVPLEAAGCAGSLGATPSREQ